MRAQIAVDSRRSPESTRQFQTAKQLNLNWAVRIIDLQPRRHAKLLFQNNPCFLLLCIPASFMCVFLRNTWCSSGWQIWYTFPEINNSRDILCELGPWHHFSSLDMSLVMFHPLSGECTSLFPRQTHLFCIQFLICSLCRVQVLLKP